ncbi:hypothetical protein CAPTEDRAFT_223791 [Capitella teleta]|uniref:Uncharacterized protein n=1 Tax=Capitella teleta TaxID=283909 RepID=R7V2C3_CAPTE|nr:hypothetical protein CAPTEDRAFT_223791 [Capitella teleta]|eukprot:ELU10486.1 hypothetical protein CAPTEDRAFT_223791 [Capitella teleta]
MAEIVRTGIEKANQDLVKEHQEQLSQEGFLRQVPMVGSIFNWLSPPAKEAAKGRSFNLSSGKIETTESIYKYHMQVQESAPEGGAKGKDGPLKNNLKPRRSSHGRTASETSSVVSDKPGDVPITEVKGNGLPHDQEIEEGSPIVENGVAA